VAAEQGVQVESHRFPIRDCDVPPPEVMASIQNVLRSASDAGKLAYVHCWGGHGRTGTVAGCWLVERGATTEAALRTIELRRRDDSHLVRNHAPQTANQNAFVKAWLADRGRRR
jgi:protein-tyrosine phosphatase